MQNSLIENIWIGENLFVTESLKKEISVSLLKEPYKKITINKENFELTFFSNNGDNFFGVEKDNKIFKLEHGDISKDLQGKSLKTMKIKETHLSFKEYVNDKNFSIIGGAANGKNAIAFLLDNGSVHLEDPKNSLGIGEITNIGIVFMNAKKIQMSDNNLLILTNANKINTSRIENFSDSFLAKEIQDISMSETHMLFLTKDNELFFKGAAPYYKDEIIKLPIANDIVIHKIFAGYHRTYIISKDGYVYAFGSNENLQLGVLSNDSYVNFFEEVIDLRGIRNIFCNKQDFTLFQTNLGNIYACGDLKKFGINGNFGFPRKISC